MRGAVLGRVLEIRPDSLTLAELIRELEGEEVGFDTRERIDRAARDLSAVGLIHLHDDFLAPTRAAIWASELLDR